MTRVVEESALLEAGRSLAREVAAQPRAALAATRRLLRGDPTEVLARIEEEARLFSSQLRSAEFQAGIRAFLARGRTG